MTVRELIDVLLDADNRDPVVITIPLSDGTEATTEIADVHSSNLGVEIVASMIDPLFNPCANCQEFSCDGCQWNEKR